MDRTEVEKRIDDWVGRLEGLYAQVEEWFHQLPSAGLKQFLRGQILQNEEDLMRQFDVPPRMMPTCAVLYGRNRVSFVPSALWIVDANGRVNVTTNQRQFILVDTEGRDGAPSRWQITTSQLRPELFDFNEQVFQKLVLHQVVEAA